ncbi:ST3 beta-galactoside alpha-2,3-sialyltransferase 7 isoform X2 [Rhincodon typus]|uniref:ST3 beta-galactoside alpha-2,3-sialyltransferase 7 isoform X2 n=1 Tax=Rhincodon typus TaxID=259920 RepID=UPI00202FEDA1|nr:ST3 beta-galactoside alpha-2,3-sialyltransferase 7 isoform X2 [Rhincodon typus]
MRTAQPTVCFRNRQQSLFTSVTLLSLCYLVLLYPSHHRQQDIWRYYSMPEDYVVQLHNRSQQIISSACKANSSQSKFSSLYSGKQPPGIPVFVQKGMIPRPGTTPYSPPLGFRDCEEQLQEVVEMLPQADLPKGVALGTCSRMNNGPVVGHENDVGWKTTLRITYPEGAPLSPQEYDPSSLLVMVTYKSTDLAWLKAMVRKEPMNLWQKMWFWQSVVESIPLESQNYRVLNLDIVREAALNLLGFPEPHDNHWRWKQVLPTLGVISIVTALYLCDEVNVAGFGYDMTRPDLPLHYYETVRMNAMNAQAVHNVNREKRFLASLVKANVVNDLTNGIRW